MSRKVLEVIIQQVHQAKYFGLIVDSTPDISHIDQLAIVLRYVDTDGDAVERFLTFHAIHNHTSSHLHDVIVEYLKSLNIDLKYCRGQSYDNASNMSGKYSGLQARLKDNHLIEYVPCSAHSLNLVGTNAAECCSSAVSFFGIVQTLYNFFSGSTHRWELLKEQMKNETRPITLKSTSTTRWSANADAVKALKKNFSAIGNVLCAISNNPEENLSTRHDAKSLFGSIKTFEFALMLIIWDAILQRINKSNISLQKVNCEISTIISLYESLVAFIQKVREEFDMYEVEAAKLAFTKEYTSKRKRNTPKSKHLDESSSTGVSLSDREKFLYETHNVLCDAIISELNKRKKAYSSLDTRFGFLTSKNMGTYEIQKAAKNFQEIYTDDIEEFPEEYLQFSNFNLGNITPSEKLKGLKSLGIEHTFPNVSTALQIMLSIPISNCSSERSFSVLKRIKNRLRSSISLNNLSYLSLLAIESDLTEVINFDDVIKDFVSAKTRKMPFHK
ncbi:hypothetical protein JTE90_003636 [Oedothorax gibbosus]|uniref:Zinc finger MYM-type protein 1 n=1 Tax=Oedothorax gibbosus TaxID=931172 RepID=A0AAV6TNX8_9ARAC|nr:hypothetical protein JTE90_003636 [Oedothorax gibbosus]